MSKKAKILVVEDSQVIRDAIVRDLAEEGHSVIGKEDGVLAWSYLDENSTSVCCVDFVISDCHMPNMGGLELLAKLRGDSRFKTVPFVILTTAGEWKNVLNAVENGASEFLLKPYTFEALKKKIAPYLKA